MEPSDDFILVETDDYTIEASDGHLIIGQHTYPESLIVLPPSATQTVLSVLLAAQEKTRDSN